MTLKSASIKNILESISDGVFTVDENWRITSFNRAAEEITRVKRTDAIGQLCSEVFRSSMCGADCALQKTLKTRKAVIGKSAYIIKADGARIPISISTALFKDKSGKTIGGAETFRDLSEIETLRQELRGKMGLGEMVSRSPQMQKIFKILPAISASPSTVLITGETGTGKELMACTIHQLSPRSKGPFVAVNCAALPDELLESELFGYKKGAFTGASQDKPGRFAIAKGGTLLLDEIGEISPTLQAKLLRVLQNRVYEPLGATRSETADARIIVATNQDLAVMVKTGAFREDLYYRVNVVRIPLPPLRRRKEDIPVIVDQLVERFNHLWHKSISGVSMEALALLMAHSWPGNVRELENVIERAFILCNEDEIAIQHLPEELTAHRVTDTASVTIRAAVQTLEAQSIQSALARHNFNRTAAAKELGIHKTTLFRRMKRLGLSFPKKDGRSQPPE